MTEEITKGAVAYDASTALIFAGQAKSMLAGASDFVIDSADMLTIAGEDLQKVKALQKSVEETRTSITGPLNQAVKAINDLFRAPKEYLDQAERSLKTAMLGYTDAQEKIAADARRKAEEEARKERERLAEIERQQQAEAQRAADASAKALKEAQAAAARGDQEAAAAAQAEANRQAEAAQSAQAEANATAQTAEVVSMVPAVAAPAKVAGISGRVNYTAQVDDLMTLIKAVAAGTAPIQCIVADDKFLGAQARAFKKSGLLYPGVTAVAERSLSARSA
jgi:colicin import membrane protein